MSGLSHSYECTWQKKIICDIFFAFTITSFKTMSKEKDPRGKNLLNLTTYLIVRIESFLGMYMAKKIHMQYLLHIHEHLFQNNIESFERKKDSRWKNLFNLIMYLIVRIKLFLWMMVYGKKNSYTTFVCFTSTNTSFETTSKESFERKIQEERIYLT